MKGGGLNAHEKEAFPPCVEAQFSQRRKGEEAQFRNGYARRLPYLEGGRNERVTFKRGPAVTPGLFY